MKLFAGFHNADRMIDVMIWPKVALFPPRCGVPKNAMPYLLRSVHDALINPAVTHVAVRIEPYTSLLLLALTNAWRKKSISTRHYGETTLTYLLNE
jgi:hypothetical protein